MKATHRPRSRSLDLRQQRLQDLIEHYDLTYERLARWIGESPETIAKFPRMAYRPLQKRLSLTTRSLLSDSWDIDNWGLRVRMLRARLSWSRQDLADYMQVTTLTVSNWERYTHQHHIPLAVRIAVAALDKLGRKGIFPPKHKELLYDYEKNEQEGTG